MIAFQLIIAVVALMGHHYVAGAAKYSQQQTCEAYGTGFIGDPDSCKEYGYCSDNAFLGNQACPTGYSYDMGTATCRVTGTFDCRLDYVEVCSSKKSPMYLADPNNCNTYCQCSADGKIAGCDQCPKYQIFDPLITECIWEKPNVCAGDSICRLLPDNTIVAATTTTDSCDTYLVCRNGIGIPQTCVGSNFNPENLSCDSTYVCTNPSAPGTGPPCTGNQVEYTADDINCGVYWSCEATAAAGSPSQKQTCPFATHFDGQNCVSPLAYACPGDRCTNINMQFMTYVNTTSTCQEYVICGNQTTISPSQTPCPVSNPYFDEVSQTCVQSELTYPICNPQ